MTKLGIRSGGLYRSFIKGQKGSLTKVNYANADGISITIGSSLPYAKIQETGGFIEAKKRLGSVKRKREVFAMEQMFWARYYKSKNPYFKSLALSIMRKDLSGQRVGFMIKPTYYFSNAERIYIEEYEPLLIQELQEKLETNFPDVQSSKDLEKGVKILNDFIKTAKVKIPNFFMLALSDSMTDRGKIDDKKERHV